MENIGILIERFRDQKEQWGVDPLFRGTYPPMVYGPSRLRPKEAGVDVRLGLDFVKAAESRKFDVVVLFSSDSDLFPAVQDAVRTSTRVELAAWSTGASTPGNFGVPPSHQVVPTLDSHADGGNILGLPG
ncbi:NYN domain-containing protein [Pseudarthrobacter oxydans]|uniref:NYN domain-containing protein n=1 Tax=Pseudarthrobacter oxydans TaxID=1671 RepID=UPI0038111C5F